MSNLEPIFYTGRKLPPAVQALADHRFALNDRFEFRRVKSPEELAQALRIRHEIFTQEQQIPASRDDDGLDPDGLHLLVYVADRPIATGRISLDGDQATLARIAVRPAHRGCGVGQRVVRFLEAWAREAGARTFVLYPHAHLERFYAELGYLKTGDAGMVGEHPVIEMRKRQDQRGPA